MDTLLGMDVSIESNRVYNDAIYFSHIIGYIGNISNEELEEYNAKLDENQQYDSNDMVGKLGLEQSYEDQLRGVDGSQKMYVDNMGKVLEIIEKTDSVAGNDIYLTLDSDLQKYCYNALEKELSYILLANLKNVTTSKEKEDIPIMLLSKNAEYTSVIGISSFSLDVVTFLRFARRIYDNSFSSAL